MERVQVSSPMPTPLPATNSRSSGRCTLDERLANITKPDMAGIMPLSTVLFLCKGVNPTTERTHFLLGMDRSLTATVAAISTNHQTKST